MTKEEIFNSLVNNLSEMFEIDRQSISMKSNLYEDLDLDSIDAIDIVVKIKKELKIELMPEQFKQVRTVEDVVNVIFDIVKDR